MNHNHPCQHFSGESCGEKKELSRRENTVSASSHGPNTEECFMNSVTSKHATSTQISWTDVWKEDSLGIKARQGHRSITRGMSWADATRGCTVADPELSGLHVTLTLTKAPMMQMLLYHTKPPPKQFLSAVNVYKPWYFCFQSEFTLTEGWTSVPLHSLLPPQK